MSSRNLKQAGLKVTLPRVKILDILTKQPDNHHLTADDVHQQLKLSGEDVGLATVYRVLTQFEQAGLIKRHNFEGGQALFEVDDGDHHDHILCVQCGRIEEFVDTDIELRQARIAHRLGYTLVDHSLTLYGTCQQCQNIA